jgi:hypothetical protein
MTKIPKYYFVYYECQIFSSASPTTTMKCQAVTDKHPIQFQIDCNEKYGNWKDEGGARRRLQGC